MELLEAIEQAKTTKKHGVGIDFDKVAELMGEPGHGEKYRSQYRRVGTQTKVIKPSRDDSYIEIKQDGTQVSERKILMSEQDMKNPEFVLRAHGFNPREFDLLSAKNNFWSGFNKEQGETISYQSKITVRPKSDRTELTADDVKSFMNVLSEQKFDKRFKLIEIDTKSKTYALEIDWADLHIGSLSWHGDTGYDNDYKIAFGNIQKIVSEIVEILNTRKVEKLIHCFLGDFLHVDTMDSKTTGGTFVDTDSRPLKMVIKGFEIVMFILDETCFVPTEVKWIPGNHSKMVEFSVFWAMQFIYKGSKHIKFDVSPMARKVFTYGTTLVGLLHGNDIGKDEKDLWLQNEFRQEWANCDYAEVHSGHIHQEQLFSEKGGITKRTNPTLKIQDKYEYDHAWSSKKVVLAYLWHKTDNLQEIFYLK